MWFCSWSGVICFAVDRVWFCSWSGVVCFAVDRVWFCSWSGVVCFAALQVWSVLQLIKCDLYSSWSGVICFAVDRVWLVSIRCEYEQATGECHNQLQKKCSAITGTEGSRLPITWTALANQNVTNNSLWEKPQEWPLCWAYKYSNRANNWWILNKTFETINGPFSWMKVTSTAVKQGKLCSFKCWNHTQSFIPPVIT